MRLETTRLTLRSAAEGDGPLLVSLFSNPEVLRYLPPRPPITLDEANQAVERRIRMEAELGYAPLMIASKDSGRFIGSGGLVPVKDTSETELVYHFLPSAWGKGYATESAVALLEFGFKTARLEQVIGLTFPDNMASSKVLEKAGMRFVGTANYYGLDLRKYIASRSTWAPKASH